MKFNDLVAGLIFLVVAGLFAAGSWNLPNPSQQPLGPSAFPLILAGFLVLCATLLAWQGGRAPERGPAMSRAAGYPAPAQGGRAWSGTQRGHLRSLRPTSAGSTDL